MAKGPFAPVEQAPIDGVRLVAERLPESAVEAGAGVAAAVVNTAATAVGVQKDRFQKQITEDATKELDAVAEGLMAIRDPEAQERLFAAAASGNPFFTRAREEFDSITLAMQQGKLPSDAAEVRMRAVMKTAINNAPEFTEELRQAARQAVGFSPEAEAVKNLLREPSAGPKTAAQKLEEEIDAQVQVLGIPREIVIAGMRNAELAQNEMAVLTLQARQGEMSANHASAMADAAIGQFTVDFSAQVQAMVTQNGGIQDVASTKVAASQMLNVFKVQALSAAGKNAPVQARGRINEQFRNAEQSMHRMIEDGSLNTLFTEHNDLIQAQTLNGVLSLPELAVMHQFGPKELLNYMAVSGKYTTPAQIDAAMQFHPSLSGIRTLKQLQPALFQAVTNQENGLELSTRDKILAGTYNTQMMQDPEATTEQRNVALERQRANLGDASTFQQFEDGQMLMRTKHDQAMAKSFGELFGNQQAANIAEMNTLLEQNPSIEFANGQYTVPGVSALDAAQGGLALNAEQRGTVARANRMLRIGKQYSDAGIIKWDGADAFHTKVLDNEVPEVAQPTTRRRRFNPDTGGFEDVK